MVENDKRRTSSIDLVRSCLHLLDKKDRFLLTLSGLMQMSLVLLDLLGVLLIGSIVAIATSAVQNKPFPNVIESLLSYLNFDSKTPQAIALIFGIVATASLLLKSFLSYYMNLRNMRFLANREARLSTRMASMIFSQPITVIQKFGTPDYQHSLSIGANSAFMGILGGLISLSSELFLQIIMASTLFVFSPTLLLIFLVYFGILFAILNWIMGSKAKFWSKEITQLSIRGNRAIADSLGSYREIVVSGKRQYFLDLFRKSKEEISKYSVKNSMLGQFSKYVFENAVIVGGVLFSAYAFMTRDALQAASLLALFVAASSRIAPSILKIQLGILLFKGATGATSKFFEILDHLESHKIEDYSNERVIADINKGITFEDVEFAYPQTHENAINQITLKINSGEFTAIVGPTGSGKSTLIDLMLGVLQPAKGVISLFGIKPEQIPMSGIRVGYVPQNVYLTDGSLIENICFGQDPKDWNIRRVKDVLDQVLLSEWALKLPEGLHTPVGERGTKLSGGQRQRLGIARALYAQPALLVLDEATSSLDAQSESYISESLETLDRNLTKVVIAHRLSTVLNADKIIYLKGGRIIGVGDFTQLRKLIPDFDRQAELMGISK